MSRRRQREAMEAQEPCGRKDCRHIRAAHVEANEFDDGMCLRPRCKCPGFLETKVAA